METKRTRTLLLMLFLALGVCQQAKGSNHTTQEENIQMLQTTTSSVGNDSAEVKDLLPESLNEMCKIEQKSADNVVHFRCDVDFATSGVWRLDILKYWISMSNVKYYFKIYCEDNSNISLPWPMKAKNLVGLEIFDCTITDFLSDTNFAFAQKIPEPDQLTVLKIIDCQIMIGLIGFMTFMMNIEDVTKDFDCGHEETLQEMSWKNVTYTFNMKEIEELMKTMGSGKEQSNTNDTDSLSNLSEVGSNFLDKVRRIEHKCDYKRLRYVDRSISSSKSKYYMSILTENSFFPELSLYNISRNSVTKIHDQFKEWWRYFPKLQMLDMSHNFVSIVDIDNTASLWETELLHVNLTYNNITSLSSSVVHQMGKTPNLFINLRENPFNCECSPEMKSLLKLLRNPDLWKISSYSRYKYLQELVCKTPESAAGKMFVDLTDADMSCPVSSLAVVPIVCLSVSVVVLVIIIVLITKFRQEIQILTYTRFNIILPCQPEDNSQFYKTYDAFVSYSSDDEIWVNKTFQGLEETSELQNYPFKFCLHQRDFIAGKTIFDNVIDSVEASRHTVIVLSKNFLKSHWCLYEFHEAFQQSIVERKRHLVVILMEEIPDKDMPKELKRCLKTFTYIRKDDVIFNDRLVYALSYKVRKSVLDDGTGSQDGVDNLKNDEKGSITDKEVKHISNGIILDKNSNTKDETAVSMNMQELYV